MALASRAWVQAFKGFIRQTMRLDVSECGGECASLSRAVARVPVAKSNHAGGSAGAARSQSLGHLVFRC
jgi:hypothetical protein